MLALAESSRREGVQQFKLSLGVVFKLDFIVGFDPSVDEFQLVVHGEVAGEGLAVRGSEVYPD